jgi:AsmA protein
MKKLLIGVAVVVVLLVVAVVAVPFLVSTDTLKAQLIAKVKDSTGRDLRIDGKVAFSLIPSLAVEANDVSFANAPGAASKDMAKLAKLEVQMKLWPMLSGRYQVDKFVLVNPVIALEVDKQGKPNWQFGQAAPAPAGKAAPAPEASGGGGLAGVRLDDIRLDNGKVSYTDHRSGETMTLDQIDLKLSLPDLDSPMKADGSVVYRAEKLSVSLSLANPHAFMDAKGSATELKLDSKPIVFDFKGNAAGSTPVKLDGTVDLKIPSVRGLAQWAGTPLAAPGSGFGPLALAGKVSVAGTKVGFSDATLSLDAIKAKGEIVVDTGGARPALKGKLDVDKLDVNPYLPPQAPSKAASSGGSDWSDQPIDVSGLKSADADFTLSANSLLYRKIQVGKSAVGLHLKDGRLEADLTQLTLYQGTGKGKVVVDASAAVPGIRAEFNLASVQVEPLLKDAMDNDRLSGTGAIDLAVTGRGKSQREIISSLNGKGGLNLANGKIKGLNLVGMVNSAASALSNPGAALAALKGGAGGSQETDFVALTATYTIANGIVHNSDLQMKSAELPVTGAGTADLPHRTVDYKITPRVAGAAVPVDIKGPWDHLSYEPDLAGSAGQLLKGGAGDLLKSVAPGSGDSAGKSSSSPGDLLKGAKGLLGK